MRMGGLWKTAENMEKHVPVIDVFKGEGKLGNDIVKVVVGKELPPPNLVEHQILWIELFGVKPDGNEIDLGRTYYTPVHTEPSACYHVKTSDLKALMATSYCNIIGTWESGLQLLPRSSGRTII
jgi:superoxide reductase